MQLHTRTVGDGPPLVLLHGLFGSNENLGNIARAFADRYRVIGMDLRNHGRSPHGEPIDYSTLAADVSATMDAHGLDHATILGHSLGGKVAMELALSAPQRIDRLIVVDIAPITYDRRHDTELDALLSLDPAELASRGEADAALQSAIPNPAIRQFLLKNLQRSGNGFAWRIPLASFERHYAQIAAAPPATGPFDGPALFLRGGDSDYLPADAEATILDLFPNAQIETIANAAHWVHIDAAEAFTNRVQQFLGTTTPGG